jgi:phytanoyl-CoA hydroxylase
MYLTESQIEFYRSNGFLVIERFWEEDVVGRIRSEMDTLLNTLDLSNPAAGSTFTTNDQTRTSDDYFLNSGGNISFFWEEKAWSDKNELKFPPIQCINKVGHGLHDLAGSEFQKVSYDVQIGDICRQLGMEIPTAVQSMYIFKQAHCGGEVGAHQDGAFLYTNPQTCLGFWWALDDCHKGNGCLWAVPGSHSLPVRRRFCRKPEEKKEAGQCGTEWRRSDDSDSDFDPSKSENWDLSNAIPLIIPAGSLVVLHHALVHYSEGNTSAAARHAYSIHVVDSKAGVSYPRDNWLQRPIEQPFNVIQESGGSIPLPEVAK